MSTAKPSKINQLLKTQPRGTVLLASWLVDKGYSFDLQRRYRESQWLESIGSGAMIRTGDHVDISGALYSLQTQLGLSIHFGGKTALAMQGKAHYLELSKQKVYLFGTKGENIPTWFRKHDWESQVEYYFTEFLSSKPGLIEFQVKEFTIKISSPARAMLECLYLSPERQDLVECYQLMESLNNLRPKQVQELLEGCSSVKVKRLFLYLAERSGHTWFNHLQLDKIDLGKGKRSLVKKGVYIPKFQITVPQVLENER
ncbi:type IV toxin-antitoxin system AbiEi family antitoxin [Roseivirga pacifica]|uniref:type IV toxin-antitoxin system AbiEi family antitoxin n=1 Tax=Roseivirga pacifica TaxID=1267423 RepID=UPI003BAF125B